ncbi:MAG TPA: signal peptidase II [Acidimicrobiales bacterium]
MNALSPAPTVRSTSRLTALTVAVAAAVVLVDQLTKSWAVNALDDHDIDVVWTLRLHLTFNGGMAFSQGRGWGPVISVVALVVVVVLLLSLRKGGSALSAVAVGLVVGGAAGNVVDRIFRGGSGFLGGEVVDFVDFQWWPVFNVADACIVIGGILLVLTSYFSARTTSPPTS